MHRRRFLALGALSLGAGLAGCSDDSSSGDGGDGGEDGDGGSIGGDGGDDTADANALTQTRTATATAGSKPGAAADCTISNAVGAAPSVPVGVDGTFADAKATVDLRWNVRTQQSAKESPDDMIGYEADEGATYLVFRFEVTNPTDRVVTIDRLNFRLEYLTPDIVETVGPTITGMDEIEYSIRPGGTVDGFLLFTVRDDATEATLRPDEANFADRVRVAFDPTCDESLAVGLPTMDDS